MVLWHGTCEVHEKFSYEKISALMREHPDAKFIAHPESEAPVLEMADHIGSTSSLLRYTRENPAKKFIIATEPGIIHQMKKDTPDKIYIPAPGMDESCACNECPYMKLNTMKKLYLCMKYELPEVKLRKNVIKEGRVCIDRMLEISAKAGL